MANSGKPYTFRLLRSEILYDVENYAFIEGDIMPDESEDAKHQVIDVAQDGNIDRVSRVMNLAYTECVEMLYPFTKKAVEEKDTDDTLRCPEEYVITGTFPASFSQSTADLLQNQLHEYVVYRILADWFSIVKPDSASNWEKKLEKIRNKIKTSMSIRRGKTRRGMSPF